MVKIVYALFFHSKNFNMSIVAIETKLLGFFCNQYASHKIGFKTCKKGFILMTHKNSKTKF